MTLQRERVRYAANPEEELGGGGRRLRGVDLGEPVSFSGKDGSSGSGRPNPRFEVLAGGERARADEEGFVLSSAAWLVHADDDDGRLACVRFSDAQYLRWLPPPMGRLPRPDVPGLGLASVQACERIEGGGVLLTLKLPYKPFAFVPGQLYVLRKRATDFTTGKVTSMLANVGDDFPALLRDPGRWARVPAAASWREMDEGMRIFRKVRSS